MTEPVVTIEQVKAIQDRLNLRDQHLVWVGPASFVLAHTDEERAAPMDLVRCELHAWLEGLDGPPEEVGFYVARRHEPDAYSEPYLADPWDFEPIIDHETEVQN